MVMRQLKKTSITINQLAFLIYVFDLFLNINEPYTIKTMPIVNHEGIS